MKPVYLSCALFFLFTTAKSQSPLLLRSAISAGGASISVSADGSKISFPQSIGQNGVTGVFNKKNLVLRQGFIQPVMIIKLYHEAEKRNLSVYPNPFSSVVHVKLNNEVSGTTELKIFDLAGIPVYIEKISSAEILKIDLSFLKRGIYILEIGNNATLIRYKIIKN